MIEKKSEVMSELTAFSEKKFEDQDFLNFLNKKKNDKKNGHDEDVNIRILNVIPELYDKHIFSYGRSTLSATRNNQSEVHNFASYEMRQSSKKQHVLLMPVPPLNENDTSLRDVTSLSNSRIGVADVVVANGSEELTHESEDDFKEPKTEAMKIHSTSAHLKNDVLPRRQELLRQDMQPRRLQSSATDHMSKMLMDSVTKTTVIQKKSLDIDYPFLRWSGDRSVKVSIPVDLSPSRHLILLPSDSRAAEILSRQVGQLTGFTTELLHPQQDDEEDEGRHAQYNSEEEQE